MDSFGTGLKSLESARQFVAKLCAFIMAQLTAKMSLSGKALVAAQPVSKPVSKLAPARGRRALQIQNAVKDVFMPALSSTMTEGGRSAFKTSGSGLRLFVQLSLKLCALILF